MIDVINEYESRLKYIDTIKDKTLKIKTVIRLFSFFMLNILLSNKMDYIPS